MPVHFSGKRSPHQYSPRGSSAQFAARTTLQRNLKHFDPAIRRLVVLPEGLAAALDGLAGSLDDGKLLPANLQADRLEAEGAVLVRQGATWSAEGHPERPSLSRRVNALLAPPSAVRLTSPSTPSR